MPEYRAPGVYVEEVERGPKPIEGVSTSTAGFLGVTERGPTEPRLITSFAEYRRVFGGYPGADPSYVSYPSNLPYAVDGFFTNGGGRCYVGRVTPKEWVGEPSATANIVVADSGGTDAIDISAVGPGEWGTDIVVDIDDATMGGSDQFKLTVGYWAGVGDVGSNSYDDVKDSEGDPDLEEVYDNLSITPSSTNYYESRVGKGSNLIDIGPETPETRPKNGLVQPEASSMPSGSVDSKDDYTGSDESGSRTGLNAFKEIDEIAMVTIPDENQHSGLTGDLITHCEVTMGDRVAILQTEANDTPSDLPPSGLDSSYAALYYPWLTVLDPVTNTERDIPPGGHIAGIYARSDTQRGVHKAPANEVIRGIQGPKTSITKGEQEGLNPKGVNCIRAFSGRGTRVWGARTISSDPLWKYLNVRRLFLFLEESIEEGTQWVVFEPNDEGTWARVRQTIRNFLTGVWDDGALMGTTPEEAFYVKCDRTTMTQDDIDNGRLICEIGVAPVKPAEFVVFRIAQWTGGAE
jgi:phage tail sheath protein FI